MTDFPSTSKSILAKPVFVNCLFSSNSKILASICELIVESNESCANSSMKTPLKPEDATRAYFNVPPLIASASLTASVANFVCVPSGVLVAVVSLLELQAAKANTVAAVVTYNQFFFFISFLQIFLLPHKVLISLCRNHSIIN